MASPRSQQALEREAIRASELGGRRRTFRPQDFIEVSVGPLSDEPTDYQLVRSESEQAVVAVISGDGKRDLIELVRADGKWRVELDASKGQPSVRDAQ